MGLRMAVTGLVDPRRQEIGRDRRRNRPAAAVAGTADAAQELQFHAIAGQRDRHVEPFVAGRIVAERAGLSRRVAHLVPLGNVKG